MKLGKRLATLMSGLLIVAGIARTQQSTGPAQMPAMTHLRVELILAEYSGDKKISSLPYTMYVGTAVPGFGTPRESIRMGVRVPIVTGTQKAENGNVVANQTNYNPVGTDIDCQAWAMSDGRYRLEIGIDRSSVYSPEDSTGQGEEIHVSGNQPILRSFDSRSDLALRDGETGEGISATDPFNGHMLKVTVTIHVVK